MWAIRWRSVTNIFTESVTLSQVFCIHLTIKTNYLVSSKTEHWLKLAKSICFAKEIFWDSCFIFLLENRWVLRMKQHIPLNVQGTFSANRGSILKLFSGKNNCHIVIIKLTRNWVKWCSKMFKWCRLMQFLRL